MSIYNVPCPKCGGKITSTARMSDDTQAPTHCEAGHTFMRAEAIRKQSTRAFYETLRKDLGQGTVVVNAAYRLRASTYPQLHDLIDERTWTTLTACALESNKLTASTQVEALDLWKKVKDLGLTKKLLDFIEHLKSVMQKLASELHLELKEVVAAFSTRPMFAFFKAVKFSLNAVFKPLKALDQLYRAGIMKVFAEIHKNGMFQKIHDGAIKVDELFDRYPILRKLAGPAVAGLLLWMWLSGNFTGEPGMDMDLTAMFKAALQGHWSAADLFTSPSGLAAITLLLTGLLSPWPSPAWLNIAIPLNLLVALCYTAFKHLPGGVATANKIKSHMKFAKV